MHSAKDLIDGLGRYVRRREFSTTTDEIIATQLATFLKKGLETGSIGQYGNGSSILHHLPWYVEEAFEDLRTSDEPQVRARRKQYEEIARGEVPSLTDLGGNEVRRVLEVNSVIRLFAQVSESEYSWAEEALKTYFSAQAEVLNQRVHAFVVKVYRQGLFTLLDQSDRAGHSGKFGSTTLMSLDSAGRLLFTFRRKRWKGLRGERSITIITESGDKEGVRFGVQSVYADLHTACALIDDVIKHWPAKPSEAKRFLRPDANINIG